MHLTEVTWSEPHAGFSRFMTIGCTSAAIKKFPDAVTLTLWQFPVTFLGFFWLMSLVRLKPGLGYSDIVWPGIEK